MFDIENDMNEVEETEAPSHNSNNQEKQSVDDENENKLQVTLDQLETLKEKFSRLNADFQNFQKRAELDRVLQLDRARAQMLLGLLSIVDNFDRAIGDSLKHETDTENPHLVGFQMIHKMLYDWLASQKVTVISQVTVFDPNLHEAVMQVTEGDIESGHIVQVFEKGFMYKDSVLRTAKVSVRA